MEPITILATVVKGIAWPATTGFSVYLLRDPLGLLLGRMGKLKFSGGGVEADFGKEVYKTANAAMSDAQLASVSQPAAKKGEKAQPVEPPKELLDLAAKDPKDAVVQAWGRLQRTTEKKAQQCQKHGVVEVKDKDYDQPIELGQKLLSANVLNETGFEVFRRLRALRNQAKNWEETQLSSQEAKTYVQLATNLKSLIDQQQVAKPAGNAPPPKKAARKPPGSRKKSAGR